MFAHLNLSVIVVTFSLPDLLIKSFLVSSPACLSAIPKDSLWIFPESLLLFLNEESVVLEMVAYSLPSSDRESSAHTTGKKKKAKKSQSSF